VVVCKVCGLKHLRVNKLTGKYECRECGNVVDKSQVATPVSSELPFPF